MRVTNLPQVLKKYEVLWAIGTMFGATQKVHMISSVSKFGHFQVGVLDPSLVPTQMDVIIGKRYLELKFVIENGGQSSASSNPQLDADKDGDHDNGRENRNIGGRDSKRSKNGPENTNSTRSLVQPTKNKESPCKKMGLLRNGQKMTWMKTIY